MHSHADDKKDRKALKIGNQLFLFKGLLNMLWGVGESLKFDQKREARFKTTSTLH